VCRIYGWGFSISNPSEPAGNLGIIDMAIELTAQVLSSYTVASVN